MFSNENRRLSYNLRAMVPSMGLLTTRLTILAERWKPCVRGEFPIHLSPLQCHQRLSGAVCS